MSAKILDLNVERAHYEPKQWLRELADRLDEHFPRTRKVLVVLASESEPDDGVYYSKTTNGLTRADTLWMLEMGREALLHAEWES